MSARLLMAPPIVEYRRHVAEHEYIIQQRMIIGFRSKTIPGFFIDTKPGHGKTLTERASL